MNGRRVALLGAAVVVAAGLPAAGLALWGDGDGDDTAALSGDRPRNVILVVGDGMGAAHREAARLALAGVDGQLSMGQLPVLGMQTTVPADPEETVTDSAAAGTAWATGATTRNGRVSVDPEGDDLTPLGVEAAAAGKATGLVTTAAVTDATPAAFFTSVLDRTDQGDVAEQLLGRARPEVVLGGGREEFGDDLLEDARAQGYDVVADAGELEAADGGRLLGLFADEEMWESADEGEGDVYDPEVPVAEMTRAALDVLSEDDDGFFLLVEDEAVDGMSHANNGTRVLESMAALDEAVEVARQYVAEHPDTLLVVAGDHDAGGLAIEDWDGDEGEDGPFDVAGDERQFALDWTTSDHTGVPTPVTAGGPGSERLAGSYPNTRLHEVMRWALLGADAAY